MNAGTKLILEKRLMSIAELLRIEQLLCVTGDFMGPDKTQREEDARRLGTAAGLVESALRSVGKVVPR